MADAGGRWVGYVVATMVGLGIGGFLAFNAFIAGMCNTWGEQCSAEENAEIARLWSMAFAAPVVAPGLYAVVDCVVASSPRTARAQRRATQTRRPNLRGPVDGTVTVWHDDQEWGVLTSPQVDGEVWADSSNLANTIPRPAPAGLQVRFNFETPGPEGYNHRAVWVTRRQYQG